MKRDIFLSLMLAVTVLIVFSTCNADSLGNEEQVGEQQQEAGTMEVQAAPEAQTAANRSAAQLEQAPPTLADVQNAFRQVAEVVTPVVVQINVVQVVEQQVPQFSNPFEFFLDPGNGSSRSNGSSVSPVWVPGSSCVRTVTRRTS